MNHPSREQLISYLYGELPPAEGAEVKFHAAACAECEAQLTSWRDAGTGLDAWKLSTPPRRPLVLRNAVKWGIAAMLMITFGFSLARFASPKSNLAQVEKTLRAEFQQQLDAARAEDKAKFAALLTRLEEQRATNYAALRADLDTVAVTAEASVRQAQRQIGQLSLIAQSGNDASHNIQ